MKIFIDTSSLVKLYHFEIGTDLLDNLFEEYYIDEIYLSSLSKLEFSSAIWKKVRTQDLTILEAKSLNNFFITDYNKYSFVEIDSHLISNANHLIDKYGLRGLRVLDSIQLASIISVKTQLAFAVTSDQLLKSFIEAEGVKTI